MRDYIPTIGILSWILSNRRLFDIAFAISVCLLVGCAGVTVTPLRPDDNTKVSKAQSGLRYYMPMPYLLVVELPPSAGLSNSTSNPAHPKPLSPSDFEIPTNGSTNLAAAATSGGPGQGAKPQKPSGDTGSSETGGPNATDSANSSQTSPAPISDVSFAASTPQYLVKLVYLPDMRRPMAMKSNTGLWGTSDMKPVLQDGWMLTSLDAAADSKMAETLQGVGSIVGSALGTGGAGSAAKTAAKATAGGPGGGLSQLPADLSLYYGAANGILRPGLYRFDYDTNGVLIKMTAVSFFTGNGAIAPDANGGLPIQVKQAK
jgi:hypothetical protein